MCIGNSPSAPTPPPRVPEAAASPTAPSRRNRGGGKQRGGVGQGTLLTSPRGLLSGSATTETKTLLGQ